MCKTISDAVIYLFDTDDVNPSLCVGWSSDGAAAMTLAPAKTEEKLGINCIKVHCMAHRLHLVINTDIWNKSPFCKRVEACMRAAHGVFTRSIVRRAAFNELENVFGKIYIPRSVIDIRWIPKFLALETLLKSRDAAIVCVSNLPARD